MFRGGKAYRQKQSLKEYIRERDNHTCQLCGKPGNIVDHIIPYAVSGSSYVENLRVLCCDCNLAIRRERKDARLPLGEWYKSLECQLI